MVNIHRSVVRRLHKPHGNFMNRSGGLAARPKVPGFNAPSVRADQSRADRRSEAARTYRKFMTNLWRPGHRRPLQPRHIWGEDRDFRQMNTICGGMKKHPEGCFSNGRSERIRTSDPLYPKQVRYQAAPRSDALSLDVPARFENPLNRASPHPWQKNSDGAGSPLH